MPLMTTKLRTEVKLSNEQRDAFNGATLKVRAARERPMIASSPFLLAVETVRPCVSAVTATSGPSTLYLTQEDIGRIRPDAGGFILPLR